MRTNSIGRIRKDLDDLCVEHTKLKRKMNIFTWSVIIYLCADLVANLFL